MVSVLAFYSNDPSLNPCEDHSFFVNILLEKSKNKQMRPRLSNLKKQNRYKNHYLSRWLNG